MLVWVMKQCGNTNLPIHQPAFPVPQRGKMRYPSAERCAASWAFSECKLDTPAEEIQVRINSKIMSIKRRAGGYRNFEIYPMGIVFRPSSIHFRGTLYGVFFSNAALS